MGNSQSHPEKRALEASRRREARRRRSAGSNRRGPCDGRRADRAEPALAGPARRGRRDRGVAPAAWRGQARGRARRLRGAGLWPHDALDPRRRRRRLHARAPGRRRGARLCRRRRPRAAARIAAPGRAGGDPRGHESRGARSGAGARRDRRRDDRPVVSLGRSGGGSAPPSRLRPRRRSRRAGEAHVRAAPRPGARHTRGCSTRRSGGPWSASSARAARVAGHIASPVRGGRGTAEWLLHGRRA